MYSDQWVWGCWYKLKIDAFKITPEDGTATQMLTIPLIMRAYSECRWYNNDGCGFDSQWRFAIQAGGSWYISDPVNSRAIGYPAY